MNAHGPNRPCQHCDCGNKPDHVGGAHLDPRSALYDGPDIALRALTSRCRPSALDLLHAARRDGWNLRVVETALHDLVEEVYRLNEQVAACRVDRDRGIRDAMTRALDCEQHGAALRFEQHQAYSFLVQADSLNEQRVVWLSAVHQIADLVAGDETPLGRRIRAITEAAGKGQDHVRKRHQPATLADCQRAGRCEHPATPPHAACQQLEVDFADEAVAA